MKAAIEIQNQTAQSDQYATAEDFGRLFTEHMDKLYMLAFLLMGDMKAAEQCFVEGLEDSVRSNTVFRTWAHLWARQAIIKNAIATLRTRPQSMLPQHGRDAGEIPAQGKESVAIQHILELSNFVRFVYVMSVLEGLSDNQCSFLLDCSLQDLHQARNQALQQLARTAENEMVHRVPIKK